MIGKKVRQLHLILPNFSARHRYQGDTTVIVRSLLVTPDNVAEISVCPGFMPVARPLAEIVATSVSALLQVTSIAPMLVRRSTDGLSHEVPAARHWSAILAVVPIVLAVLVAMNVNHLEWVVVVGLGLFGFAFAVNSSVHSYLILAYAGSEKAAEDVGFYYAANALGRFIGTLLSGLLYQWGGLFYSLCGSAIMLIICWLFTLALPASRHQA